MTDLTRPRFLLDPLAWANFESQKTDGIRDHPDENSVLLPLEFAASVGGPIKEFFLRMAKTRSIAWEVSPEWIRSKTHSDRIRMEEAKRWLGVAKPAAIVFTESVGSGDLVWLEELKGVPYHVRAPAWDVHEWIDEVFGGAILPLRSSDLYRRVVQQYVSEVPLAERFPWEGLAYFPGFARTRLDQRFVSKWSFNWTRLRVLFSPQDEKTERLTLQNGEVMLNPTCQFFQHASPGSQESDSLTLMFVCRSDDQIQCREVMREEALLVDAISEESDGYKRLSAAALLRAVSQQNQASEAQLSDILARLISDGVILSA